MIDIEYFQNSKNHLAYAEGLNDSDEFTVKYDKNTDTFIAMLEDT